MMLSVLVKSVRVPVELLQDLRRHLSEAESILESIELMNDPVALKHFREAKAELARGEGLSFETWEEMKRYLEGIRDEA